MKCQPQAGVGLVRQRRDRRRAPAWALPVEQCRRGCDRCPGGSCRPTGGVGSASLRSLDAYRGKYLVLEGTINTTIRIAGLQADQSVRELTGRDIYALEY